MSASPSRARLSLRHLALRIERAKFAATVEFYRDHLGLGVVWAPDPDNVYLAGHDDNLALHAVDGPVARDGALAHLGLFVADPAEVAAWERRLCDEPGGAAAERLAGTRTHRDGAVSCYVRDPAGHVVQILWVPPAQRGLERAR